MLKSAHASQPAPESSSSETSSSAQPPRTLPGRPVPPWVSELMGMPASALLDLPVPPALCLRQRSSESGHCGEMWVSEDGESDRDPVLDPLRVELDVDEWKALVLGVEADRVWPGDLDAWLIRKREEADFRLEAPALLAGARPDLDECWDLRAVLERLDLELLSLRLDF